ncbi:hypothetical protein Tco_0772068 [Tanacetum coccineum]|uniref:Uncharacterized protein n=1 Tax=Tanacetum coccineum TaxID=301880 RepID=A0ABQ4ZHY4_9ASTR
MLRSVDKKLKLSKDKPALEDLQCFLEFQRRKLRVPRFSLISCDPRFISARLSLMPSENPPTQSKIFRNHKGMDPFWSNDFNSKFTDITLDISRWHFYHIFFISGIPSDINNSNITETKRFNSLKRKATTYIILTRVVAWNNVLIKSLTLIKWLELGTTFDSAAANVERAIMNALKIQYADVLTPLKDSIPKRLSARIVLCYDYNIKKSKASLGTQEFDMQVRLFDSDGERSVKPV